LSKKSIERYCYRCGLSWRTNKKRPRKCPRCKSFNWNDPTYNYNYSPTFAKKERRPKKVKGFLSNQSGFSLGTMLLFIFIILVLSITFYVLLTLEPGCNPEDQIILEGKLLGFQKNNSFNNFYDVKIENRTYLFKYFKEDYMSQMLGNNIFLTCCKRIHDYNPREYYDFVSCFIKEV